MIMSLVEEYIFPLLNSTLILFKLKIELISFSNPSKFVIYLLKLSITSKFIDE